jgi:hypothetical protein
MGSGVADSRIKTSGSIRASVPDEESVASGVEHAEARSADRDLAGCGCASIDVLPVGVLMLLGLLRRRRS